MSIAPSRRFSLKHQEALGGQAPPYEDPVALTNEKGIKVGEAADIFGDVQTAEEYGYVTRG
jgi:hypothetical protein